MSSGECQFSFVDGFFFDTPDIEFSLDLVHSQKRLFKILWNAFIFELVFLIYLSFSICDSVFVSSETAPKLKKNWHTASKTKNNGQKMKVEINVKWKKGEILLWLNACEN